MKGRVMSEEANGLGVDINFVEFNTLGLPCETLKDRRDGPARATPDRPKVEDSRLILADLKSDCVSIGYLWWKMCTRFR
jgi:hypothetical protein